VNLPLVNLSIVHDEIRPELDRAWHDTVSSGAFILGRFVEEFEAAWAAYCGVPSAVGVGSGTEAIELVLRGHGIGPGDEVIVPAATFIATAAAVVATGATPVFTDVDPATLLITADHVRAAITPRTAAVIVVHLYGTAVDIGPIREVARAAGIAVVEDAAQAHGAVAGGERVGALGTAAAFSHYPTKNLGAFGDGGTITTADADLVAQVRLLRNHGRASQRDDRYEIVGRTGRLDGVQAAILTVKLRHLDRWNQQRREIVGWYDEALPEGLDRIRGPRVDESAPHLCVVRVPERDAVRARLAELGIGTGIHYPDPVPRTPAFGGRVGEVPVAEAASDAIVSLPLWPGMKQDDVEQVTDALRAHA
jgi:dTDP-4-amino-4,6-dideoxygalactose transaminase